MSSSTSGLGFVTLINTRVSLEGLGAGTVTRDYCWQKGRWTCSLHHLLVHACLPANNAIEDITEVNVFGSIVGRGFRTCVWRSTVSYKDPLPPGIDLARLLACDCWSQWEPLAQALRRAGPGSVCSYEPLHSDVHFIIM